MKTVTLKDKQGLLLLQAVKILLGGSGARTVRLMEFRLRVP